MMTFLLLLTTLSISSAVTSKALTQKQCSQGWEVWCKDLKTATQCGKVLYCTQYVWKEAELDPSEERPMILCEACLKVMEKLKKMVSDNDKVENIANSVKNVCKKMGPLSEKCHKVVDKYKDIIVNALKDDAKARQICIKLKFCPSEFKGDSEELSNSGMLEASDCGACGRFLQEVKPAITEDMNRVEIKAVLDNACNGKQSNFSGKIEACSPVNPVPLLGSKECKKGPLYWCTNTETAKKCNAVIHCEKYFWQKSSRP